jgi:aspartate/methionine/tyrosine aminotransferase
LPALFQEGRAFLKYYRETVRSRLDTAQTLLRHIPGLRWVPPCGGFYLMAELLESRGLSEEEWVIGLMEKTGTFVHPGYFYDYERGVHLVISFLTREEELEEGIRAIGQFIKL